MAVDWGRYGRRPAMVVAAVAFIDAIERGILPGVLSDIQADFGFSDFQGGLLGSAVVLAGALMVIPAGYVADRHHRPHLIAVVLASWGVVAALTAAVRNWAQLLGARALLGLADSIDNPASASLLADYYPPRTRSRAYALLRIAPMVGTAIGTALGGLVGAIFGWRWAFIAVGVPGSLFAVAVWRLPNPGRGEHEEREATGAAPTGPTPPAELPDLADLAELPELAGPLEAAPVRGQLTQLLRIRSFRSLVVGSGLATGGLSGLGFWAPTFFERHSGLSGGAAAAVTGGLILVGAMGGTWVGAMVTDRMRRTGVGASMVQGGVSQILAALVLLVAFSDVPTWAVRIPALAIGVPLMVNALPGLAATTSEVVPAPVRGLAFSLVTFVSTLISAASAPLIGLIADRFEFVVDGETKGDLALAFQLTVPVLILGALVVLRGRRYAEDDRLAAGAPVPRGRGRRIP